MKRASFGLAHAGLREGEARRLRAAMLAAVAQGVLAGDWRITDPARADVVVTSAGKWNNLDRAVLLNPHQLVAVLADENEALPPGILRLDPPINTEGLLELLSLTEQRALGTAEPEVAEPEHPMFHLARLLRSAHAGAGDDSAWCITGLSRAPIYVIPADNQLFSSESLLALQHVDVQAEIDFFPVSPADIDAAGTRAKPLAMLQWSVGLRTGVLGLLPWLLADATFQLRTLPEFQILHHEPCHRRLAAAFSRPVHGIRAAMGLTRLDLTTVSGFVNAADLCGYLDSQAPTPDVQTRSSSGSRGRLAQLMRRALRLASHD